MGVPASHSEWKVIDGAWRPIDGALRLDWLSQAIKLLNQRVLVRLAALLGALESKRDRHPYGVYKVRPPLGGAHQNTSSNLEADGDAPRGAPPVVADDRAGRGY